MSDKYDIGGIKKKKKLESNFGQLEIKYEEIPPNSKELSDRNMRKYNFNLKFHERLRKGLL